MDNTGGTKGALRSVIRERVVRLTAEERSAVACKIFRAVECEPAFIAAHSVALFASLPDEPSTEEFLHRWYGVKRLLLPRIVGDDMEFCDYEPDSMRAGAYGIAEPASSQPVAVEDIDFMILPGRAFTPEGWRLGRGKGYYDRYMAKEGFRAFTVGVCFAVQVVEHLPLSPYDKRVDKIIYY